MGPDPIAIRPRSSVTGIMGCGSLGPVAQRVHVGIGFRV